VTKAELDERIQTAIGFLVCQGVMQKAEAEKIRARHKRKKDLNGNNKPIVFRRVQT
jgi:hypothetical protein